MGENNKTICTTEQQLDCIKRQWRQKQTKAVHNNAVFSLVRCSSGYEEYQQQEQQQYRGAEFSRLMQCRADRIRFKGGFTLLEYDGERDKRCNGIAAVRRNKFKLIKGGQLTEREERLLDDIVRQAMLEVDLNRLRERSKGAK